MERQESSEAQKRKIRKRYQGIDPNLLEVIPAKPRVDIFQPQSEQRVAVYARVSTDDPRQTSSYELQKNYYEDMVDRNPLWKLVDIYADEGISGTSLKHRDAFVRMISDCRMGKIDLIVTKSVSRFARNIVDCISYVRMLAAMNPPVGVVFETERIYTLDSKSEMSLSFIATLAQEESHNKAEIMNASIEMRFSHGIFLTPAPLGFDQDEDGNLIINEEESKTVRLIFLMYLCGYSTSQIAKKLENLNRKTKRGNTYWPSGSILGILQNERYCGDVLARKTFTPSYLDHKSKRNRNDRPQYYQRNHHESIISHEDFIAVQQMIRNARYRHSSFLPQICTVSDGLLKGYVSINPRWAGFHADDYAKASTATDNASFDENICISVSSGEADMRGFEFVRSQFFEERSRPALSMGDGKIQFNVPAVRKLGYTPYIEILAHPANRMIAVRPVEQMEKNAISWTQRKGREPRPKQMGAAAFLPTLYSMFCLDEAFAYHLEGDVFRRGKEAILLFDVDDATARIPRYLFMECEEKKNKKELGYPLGWMDSFGEDYYLRQYRERQIQEASWNTGNAAVPSGYGIPEGTDEEEARKQISILTRQMEAGRNG